MRWRRRPCGGPGAAWHGDLVGHSDLYRGAAFQAIDAAVVPESRINDAELLITNPPWKAVELHRIIRNLVWLRPTWLLLYSDWLFTKQAVEFQPWIRQIVTMPRVVWIEDTKSAGFDNCCWILFDADNDRPFMTSGWG